MAAEPRQDTPPKKENGGSHGKGGNPWAIEPMSPALLDSPVDFIVAEHHRQREAASLLTMVADGEFDERGVMNLAEFLEGDFALHIGDEEIVLFPILRQRCLPEDNIDAVIERLQEEHKEDETIVEESISLLKNRLQGQHLAKAGNRRLRLFAEHICQHLALENGVLLPIARVRLSVDDLGLLSQMLKKRRNM